MRFGLVPTEEAEGAVLAHSVRLPSRVIRKGTRITSAEVSALEGAGVREVMAARLDPEDLPEDEAAALLGQAAAGTGVEVGAPTTGRANLRAAGPGLLLVDASRLRSAHEVDEGISLATLPALARVRGQELVATAKIVPFALGRRSVEEAADHLAGPDGEGALRVAPFVPRRVALVVTEASNGPTAGHAKAEAVTRARLESLECVLTGVRRVPHERAALAAAITEEIQKGCEMVLVLGASAVADRDDVVPGAVVDSGGRVERLGIPVDPGNLLMLASIGELPLVGMPGCARSPKRSGFDTILERLVAGVAIDAAAMADLSVGGLLREIQTRPQPRGGPPRGSEAELAVLVLAAGRSSRMGDLNKLTQPIDNAPMVARVAEGALAAEVGRVTVVVGHAAHEVEAALDGQPVALVHNPDFAEGLSTSLRAGINAVADASAAIVCLADMPRVRPETLRALAAAHAAAGGGSVCVPVFQGKRGNPVLWDASWFPELRTLAGDVGARGLLAEAGDALHEVDVDDPGVLIDVDTRDALARLRRPSAGATAPDDGNV